jgi:hypothetical protein
MRTGTRTTRLPTTVTAVNATAPRASHAPRRSTRLRKTGVVAGKDRSGAGSAQGQAKFPASKTLFSAISNRQPARFETALNERGSPREKWVPCADYFDAGFCRNLHKSFTALFSFIGVVPNTTAPF